VQAFSKINLFLEVMEKRADGYHNLRSVMQSLQLCDVITIRGTDAPAAPLLTVTCTHPNLPTNEQNLVTKAAKYMMDAYNILKSIKIHIEKNIPVAAGLGGGSSDCAATITGFNALFNLGLTVAKMQEIGLRFGADVPFCITGGTALAEGIGEILTPLPPHPDNWVVLACLPVSVSTQNVFAQFKPGEVQGDIKKIMAALQKENILEIATNFFNNLMPITTREHPKIKSIIQLMKEQGAINAVMSGSGPSVFGYFTEKNAAEAVVYLLKEKMKQVYLTKPERMKML